MSTHRLNPSRKGDYHVLIGPYDGVLVAWLKRELPDHARQWDDVLKAWRIGNDYVEQVQARLDR